VAGPGYAAGTVANYADALNAVTFAAVEPNRIYDQVFDNSPLSAVVRHTDHLTEKRGGLFIQKQLNVGKSPNAGWYTGGGGWQMAKFDGIIAAGWDWKLAHDGVVVLGQEIILNSEADEAIVDLVQARVDVSSLTLPDLFATDLYTNNPYGTRSDNTPGNPASIEGLAVLVDDGTISNTVGSVSRTTYPILKSKVNYNSSTATLITDAQKQYLAANRGQLSRVRLVTTTEALYGSFWGSLQTPERYVIDPRRLEAIGLKTTGGNDLAFNDAPVLVDEKVPTSVPRPVNQGGSGGYWYMLNLDFFELVVHPDRFFSLGQWYKDPYGDQYFMDIYLACALLCTRPNKQAALWVSGG
jgi:hypothetical protein